MRLGGPAQISCNLPTVMIFTRNQVSPTTASNEYVHINSTSGTNQRKE